jgi:hypothetical protein
VIVVVLFPRVHRFAYTQEIPIPNSTMSEVISEVATDVVPEVAVETPTVSVDVVPPVFPPSTFVAVIEKPSAEVWKLMDSLARAKFMASNRLMKWQALPYAERKVQTELYRQQKAASEHITRIRKCRTCKGTGLYFDPITKEYVASPAGLQCTVCSGTGRTGSNGVIVAVVKPPVVRKAPKAKKFKEEPEEGKEPRSKRAVYYADGTRRPKRVVSESVRLRNALVNKIREERGITLIEASKIVKAENLSWAPTEAAVVPVAVQ